MEFSELTVKLLLIFFPGIISSLLFDKLTGHKAREFKAFLLHSYIFGMSSYLLLYIFVYLNNQIVKMEGDIPTWKITFLQYLTDGKTHIIFREVIAATIISIIIGFIYAGFSNHYLLLKIAKSLNMTKKFKEVDVWSHIFESPEILWIVVRDLQHDIMYEGWVSSYSDTYDVNELFLQDVIVYRNSTADEMYKLEAIYLTRKKDELILEFPKLEKFEKKVRYKKRNFLWVPKKMKKLKNRE